MFLGSKKTLTCNLSVDIDEFFRKLGVEEFIVGENNCTEIILLSLGLGNLYPVAQGILTTRDIQAVVND